MSRSKGQIHEAQKNLNRLQNACRRTDRRKKARRRHFLRRRHESHYRDRYELDRRIKANEAANDDEWIQEAQEALRQ